MTRRRGTRWRLLTAMTVITALALAGCSSGTGHASSGTPSVIKVGMIADEGTAVDLSWAVAAAEGALIRINAHGGIAGHQVELVCGSARIEWILLLQQVVWHPGRPGRVEPG
jgi:hypothetical protein